MAFDFIAQQLHQRQEADLLRSRRVNQAPQGRLIRFNDQRFLNFAGNDYLGLANHPKVIEAFRQAAQNFGIGSGGSPLLTGYQTPHAELEALLCNWLDLPAALLFSSGFSANQAVIKALMSKGDLLLQDKLNHASLMEAGMLSDATMKRFHHNDMKALSSRLDGAPPNTLVVSEGVFSMDGDGAPLAQMSDLCQANRAWLMIDDAHGLGVCGPGGRGSCPGAAIKPDILMATFGKALGVGGAFVGASQALVDFLMNFSRSYVYSTAMPAAQAAAVSAAITVLKEESLSLRLADNICYFKQCLGDFSAQLLPSDTAIQPWLVGDSGEALRLSERLRARGIWAPAIRPPTVPPHRARLRITLSAAHLSSDIDALVEALSTTAQLNIAINNEGKR
jgi:8-amino-7-oxononanoate synthase